MFIFYTSQKGFEEMINSDNVANMSVQKRANFEVWFNLLDGTEEMVAEYDDYGKLEETIDVFRLFLINDNRVFSFGWSLLEDNKKRWIKCDEQNKEDDLHEEIQK